jgi:hypothetical protein
VCSTRRSRVMAFGRRSGPPASARRMDDLNGPDRLAVLRTVQTFGPTGAAASGEH